MHKVIGSKVNKEIHSEGGNKENRINEARVNLVPEFLLIAKVCFNPELPSGQSTAWSKVQSIHHSFIYSFN